MHRDGQKVEVMHSGFVADADANIAVRGRHVAMSSAAENAQHCRSTSAMHYKFIAQIK
jgi:hypothetical protein